jgi:hypothetical protein
MKNPRQDVSLSGAPNLRLATRIQNPRAQLLTQAEKEKINVCFFASTEGYRPQWRDFAACFNQHEYGVEDHRRSKALA